MIVPPDFNFITNTSADELETMKKKLLFIVHSLPFGGIEQVLLNICNGLDKDKYEPHIACLCARGENAINFEEAGVKVKVFQGVSSLNPLYAPINIITFLQLTWFIRELNPQVVQCEMFYGGTLGRIGACLCSVPKIIYGIHNVYSWKGSVALFIERHLAKITTTHTCPSNLVAETASKAAKIPLAEFSVIANGISLPLNAQTENTNLGGISGTNDRTKGKLSLCYVARMVEKKRPDLVVKTLRKLLERKIDCHLTMIGDGPMLLKVTESTKDIRAHITFTGSMKDPSALIENSHIVLIPSDREGFCIVTGEALLRNTPVLMRSLPVLKECWSFCPDLWFLNSDDPSSWADRVLEILNEENRTLLREQLDASKETVKVRYSVTEMCKSYEAIYSEE